MIPLLAKSNLVSLSLESLDWTNFPLHTSVGLYRRQVPVGYLIQKLKGLNFKENIRLLDLKKIQIISFPTCRYSYSTYTATFSKIQKNYWRKQIVSSPPQAGLRIRYIFGWIRIRQIRILKTGSGSYQHLPRINSNIYRKPYFYINIFRYFYTDSFPPKLKNSTENVLQLHFLKIQSLFVGTYYFTQPEQDPEPEKNYRIRRKRSGSATLPPGHFKTRQIPTTLMASKPP